MIVAGLVEHWKGGAMTHNCLERLSGLASKLVFGVGKQKRIGRSVTYLCFWLGFVYVSSISYVVFPVPLAGILVERLAEE